MQASLSTKTTAAYLHPLVTAVHPPELETDDSSLATEVLPAPPPLASVSGQRRDSHLKRLSQVFSYLPASDPGSTYSGLMGGLGLSLVPEDDGRLRKRPRVEKTAIINRAQRASARNPSPTAAPPFLSPPAPHPASGSTSDSVVDVPPPPKARDKGKAREKPLLRVKEEPQSISLNDIFEPPSAHPNDDHCSACRSHGALVYCDGCPRAFHLWCLDPPLDTKDVPEHRWYCPACIIRQHPPPKLRRSLLAPLLHQLQTSIPTEFELPEDIRGFFKDVATGPKGAYQDSSETKITRSSRFAVQDEREPFRLKDKVGGPVLCFRCGKSALPDSDTPAGPIALTGGRETRRRTLQTATGSGDTLWKSIVSCDHCSLHWHLDCLSPPLSSMPPAHKKWMCPAHVDHIAPKRRVPRQVPPVTDVTERNRPNNGNIEIIPADSGADKARRMAVDEVHINGRRYRVPERVIVLDFWDKLRGRKPVPTHGLLSGLSSPLTSLSSLDDIEPYVAPPQPEPPSSSPDPPAAPPEPDAETMHAVELLFGVRTAVVKDHVGRMEVDQASRGKSDMAVQTEPEGCVKLDVKEAKQLSGLISATLQDVRSPSTQYLFALSTSHQLDRPESSSPPKVFPRARAASTPKGRGARQEKSAIASGGSLRKSSRLASDTGTSRVTRSKAAPIAAPGTLYSTSPLTQTPQRRTRVETSIPRIPSSPDTLTPPRTTRSAAASRIRSPIAATPPDDTKRPTTSTSRPTSASKSHGAPVKLPGSPVVSNPGIKSEPSAFTSMPPPAPSPNKSPFKIRIPSAINTAVAAATAAAAAASTSSSSGRPSRRTHHAESSYNERDSASTPEFASSIKPLKLEPDTDVQPLLRENKRGLEVTTPQSNGRLRSARKAKASFQPSSNVAQSASNASAAAPSRITRSATTTPRRPAGRPRDPFAALTSAGGTLHDPFDLAEISSDSSSDFVPSRATKRFSGTNRRLVLPRGVGL